MIMVYKERKSNFDGMINRSKSMGSNIGEGQKSEQKVTFFGGILKRSNKIGGGRE